MDAAVLPEIIGFHMESWLENAGIVGLTRILDEDDYAIKDNQLSIKTSALKTIDKSFFKFFIDTYGKYTRYQQIINWLPKIEATIQMDFENYNFQEYETYVKWFNDNVKYFVKSGSYRRMRPLVHPEIPIEKYLDTVTKLFKGLSKKKRWEDTADNPEQELAILFAELKKIVQYFADDTSKRYFLAKNLVYRYVNKGWDGISFLNSQSKIVDIYQDYYNYFVQPVIDFLSESHRKGKIICATCGRKMRSKEGSGYSFLNGMGYDYGKKNSNAYMFNSDQFLCPVCRLMYSAVPAGFAYNLAGNHGIFVNYTGQSLENLRNANDGILDTLTETFRRTDNNVSPWGAFYETFRQGLNKSSQYTLANTQVINRKDEHYYFSLIPEITANVLKKIEKIKINKKKDVTLLSALNKALIPEYRGIQYCSIYDEVIKRLLNQTNMNSLLNDMLLLKASNKQNIYITATQILYVVEINVLLFNELGVIKLDSKVLSKIHGYGMEVAKGYRTNPNKAKALAYQLLQALKMQNQEKFMNILLNCYLYQQKIVPSAFQQIRNTEVFNQLGYAFIAGLISGEEKGRVQNEK
ncbi:MAG: Cas8a1 family CRISPR/Cas system-associated protein [Liquorilactobacillus sp.]|uniref:Cas8a1 family CRISPR/Cas system-associated protein n=2 Tax=Liquorilactobacillus sp. TaxID=2767923 RepID=UPI0039E81A99